MGFAWTLQLQYFHSSLRLVAPAHDSMSLNVATGLEDRSKQIKSAVDFDEAGPKMTNA
jgi:hypothetical protein